MSSIGGYFELELRKNSSYHQKSIALNSGRNAFEYVLKVNGYNRIFIPYYTCEVIVQTLEKNNIEYDFYSIDKNLEPVFDYKVLKENEAFLYTNYFGVKDGFVEKLAPRCNNLIIDNAQSFYSNSINGVESFYSPRKFFGVPDGGYVYAAKAKLEIPDKDTSYNRCSHLLIRADEAAEKGYSSFLKNEELIGALPLSKMSTVTMKILGSIDYQNIAERRQQNFNQLNRNLRQINDFKIDKPDTQIPMVYPLKIKNAEQIKKRLLLNKIYTAGYWKSVLDITAIDSLEQELVTEFVFLPIDQRYGEFEMNKILEVILEH